jgi:hypothetical protein
MKTMRALCRLMVVGAVLAAVSGCGYTTRSLIAGKYHTIYIEPFANKIDITGETTANNYRIYRPLLETDVTSAVIRKFLIDGNLKPVKQKENADLVLEGSLVDFRKDALTYTGQDYVNEYRVSIAVHLKLISSGAQSALWEEPSFSGTATYFLTGTQATSESAAITVAVGDLSRRIVERTVDQW